MGLEEMPLKVEASRADGDIVPVSATCLVQTDWYGWARVGAWNGRWREPHQCVKGAQGSHLWDCHI